MEEINVILNNKPVKASPEMTVLDLARKHGIHIPTLCHDPRLEPFSSCFLCVVEIEGMKGLQPSCSTKLREGMTVTTDNDKIRKARKTVLDLMLSNHYADCVGPCKQTCPAGVDVQGYISLIEKGQYTEAIGLIKEVNPLPAICGRVCVRPCEVACRRNLMDEDTPVGIDYLKRFAADRDLEAEAHFRPEIAPSTGKKVAIIGAGPGGLSCGYFLQQKGHQCDIFEAAPHPGGWLRYGIPEYRLPNDLLQKEIDTITETGVSISCNQKLGDNLSYAELQKNYDAVILTIGSQKGTLVGCEGEDAGNVFSGIDFLRNMEVTGQKYDFRGKTVAVVGGGNTAMDCCRTSVRCGADRVYVIYRRTEKEMPANPIEIHESKLEGVEYLFLTNPKKINKNSAGEVKSVTCLRMELGEPDASGRRRPVPVEGSDFDIEVDYILAAIGQKTDVNFLDDINRHASNGQLNINRWGDIDAVPETLQTGIPSVFAAGDGVSGPATIIEAIAQAKKASLSCHQFLSGEEIRPEPAEFLSKKENFREVAKTDIAGRFARQERQEMPTLPAGERNNFLEVELGYAGGEVAATETARCLECGCTELFSCDLKRYATEYGAEQKRYGGEFREYNIDFSHPYIEIDNNKCILCARCVRICSEVVGASALGLVNRGFDTFIAPSMGDSLRDTPCETCGLCISTCPTGAISENKPFKPGPVKTGSYTMICNYCSVGCKLEIKHRNGFVMEVAGLPGLAGPDGNTCRFGKFGYNYMNSRERIVTPLLREKEGWKPVSWEEALDLIASGLKRSEARETAVFGGARLSNEEQYLLQKLGRAGIGTPWVGSFAYLGTEASQADLARASTPWEQIGKAGKIYLLDTELNQNHGVAGFLVNLAKRKGTGIIQFSTRKHSSMSHKVDQQYRISSVLHLLKAANHFILSEGLENRMFLNDRCSGMDSYQTALLKEDFSSLVELSGMDSPDTLKKWVREFIAENQALVIASEKELDPAARQELRNLVLLTGKLGKTGSGMILLKEKNNAQGLFDMGLHPGLLPGNVSEKEQDARDKFRTRWELDALPVLNGQHPFQALKDRTIRNLLVFGEDPVGCSAGDPAVKEILENLDFLVVQDYTLTGTARMAHLVLPASLPFETGGSYTNAIRQIQEFEKQTESPSGMDNIQQLLGLMKRFSLNGLGDLDDVKTEWMSLVSGEINRGFHLVAGTSREVPVFSSGVDAVVKNFEDSFNSLLQENDHK